MKIAIVLPSLNMGGGEKFAVDLSNELAKDSNNQVTLCVLSKINKNMILVQNINSDVSLISLNKSSGFDYKILFTLQKFLKNNQFNIVHTHLRSILYSTWSILTIKDVHFIHTFHTLINKEVNSYIKKISLKTFFTHFNVTPVAITPKVREGLEKYFKIQQPNMILNGVSPLKKSNNFKETQKEVFAFKKDIHTKVFINIARVTKVKNQKLLIEAFSEIHKNAILIIIGSLDNEPSYAKECQQLAQNFPDIFLLGEKNNAGDYLLCSDALCLSSIYEGLPLVILEAMSLGRPTLSTNVGGIPDVIHNSINGYLSANMSIDAYVEIINEFIDNSTIEQEKIYSIFRKNYSMSICKDHYYNLYKNTLTKEKL